MSLNIFSQPIYAPRIDLSKADEYSAARNIVTADVIKNAWKHSPLHHLQLMCYDLEYVALTQAGWQIVLDQIGTSAHPYVPDKEADATHGPFICNSFADLFRARCSLYFDTCLLYTSPSPRD